MNEYPVSLTVEEGLAKIIAVSRIMDKETVNINCANGRVLADNIVANEDIPPFPRSPYDGYALRSEDVASASAENPVTLDIIEEVPAGYAPVKMVEHGQATKILTGAPVPDGADLIVKFEDAEFTAETVTFFKAYKKGENIVPRGEDVSVGETVIKSGDVMSPALCGIAAGLGYTEIAVYRRPKALIISTGDELVDIGNATAPGKIRNSSAYTIAEFLKKSGAAAERYGIVADEETIIAEAIADAAKDADIVVTTGGVSVGDYDMIQRAMKRLDADVLFWKVKMKPGSSFLAAEYKGKLILCLSGNPSAAVVSYFMLGMPAVRKMSGCSNYDNEIVKVHLSSDFKKKSPNRRFLPGKLEIKEGMAYISLADRQGNGMLHPLDGCNLLGELPAGSEPVTKDDIITAYRLFN